MSNVEQILETARENGVRYVVFQSFGIDGMIRCKASHSDFLESHMKSGIGICKPIDSVTPLDHFAHGGLYGAESGEFRFFPDPSTFSLIPYMPGAARFICELREPDLKESPTDARTFLRRIVKKAEASGFTVMAACESEFSFFKMENGKIAPPFVEKAMSPNALVLTSDILAELIDSLTKMNVKVERFTKEFGPSQFEIQTRYADALKAADDSVTLRSVVKAIALKHGLVATFLPKPTPYIGNGMHLHLSLWDRDRKQNLFYSSKDRRGLYMSELGYWFIGGVLRHTKALCPLIAPLVNSYKRLLDASWAPSRVFYGGDHRDAAVRIPSLSSASEEKSARIEYRVPDASSNPYLALGATIASGLDGIENKCDPGEPVRARIYELSENEREKLGVGSDTLLPRTLGEALSAMRESGFLKDTLGEPLFSQYLLNRETEWKEFREHVTDWEVYNYLDAV